MPDNPSDYWRACVEAAAIEIYVAWPHVDARTRAIMFSGAEKILLAHHAIAEARGWRMVPVVATEKMCVKGRQSWACSENSRKAKLDYSAMVAAAPRLEPKE